MGQAKRRQQFDPTYGTPAEWRIEILDKDGPIFTLPMAVPRLDNGINQTCRAEALTVLVMSALQEPTKANWQRLEESLGPETRQGLELAQRELPEDFWLDLYWPDGNKKGSAYSTHEAQHQSGHQYSDGELRERSPEKARKFAGRA